jgi:HAD superfamily hydrolase (TIGR01509 family)
VQRRRRHAHYAFGERLARGRNLVRDVDHPRRPFAIEVRKGFRHGDQDMRMPRTEGVLFDYGRTLVTFDYPTEELLEVMRDFRPRIESALGVPAPEAESILEQVLLPLEKVIGSSNENEVDYVAVYREAWSSAGWQLPDGLLHDILDAEQLCWDRSVRLDPDALQILSWLGAHGIKRGVCSNAPFPPKMMRRQVDTNGVGEMVDAIVFSSEVGRRKPAPEVYHAALDAIGVEARHALFVGDRVREDYEGPRAVGMRAVIFMAHAEEPPPDGVPTIASLSEVPRLL